MVAASMCKSSKSKLTRAMAKVLRITLPITSCLSSKRSNYYRCQIRCSKPTLSRNTRTLNPRTPSLGPTSATRKSRKPSTSEASKDFLEMGVDALYLIRSRRLLGEENSCRPLHKKVVKSSKKSDKSSRGNNRTNAVEVARRASVAHRGVPSKTLHQHEARRRTRRKC